MSQIRPSFRILVSTDNHLGYKENHRTVGNDSFDAFEEVLQIAKRNQVDLLLLGGDLFHEISPSQSCLYRVMTLFQKYIFGSGDLNFATKSLTGIYPANYLNENLNIDLPIFAIHGNHDYPSNTGENISSLDLMHASHLLNYFGKQPNVDELKIEPILFEKGPVKIALYGIGHVKDTRLHYLFEKGKVEFVEPPSPDYMNILIIHQNRFKGIRVGVPYKNCIQPTMIPNFFDLVIWGNEHECCEELMEDPVQNFYIYQPGSSVSTSLNQAEALPKHCGFFEIYEQKNFRFQAIKLKMQRPLYVKNIELESLIDDKGMRIARKKVGLDVTEEEREREIEERLEEEVMMMLQEHENKKEEEKYLKDPPLVRLKVEFTGFDIIRIKQLESKFLGRVANEGQIDLKDVLKFWRKTVTKKNTEAIKNNERINQRFEECLKQKISFETLTSDSSAIIGGLIEEMMQTSKQKPKVLFNYSMFTQSGANNRFTMQSLTNQINDSLNFASTKLLNQRINQFQTLSRKILQKHNEFSDENFKDTDSYHQELAASLREYDTNLNQTSDFITQKLKEYSETKSLELLGKAPSMEEEKGEPETEIQTKKRGPTKKKASNPQKSMFDEDEEAEYERSPSSHWGSEQKGVKIEEIETHKRGGRNAMNDEAAAQRIKNILDQKGKQKGFDGMEKTLQDFAFGKKNIPQPNNNQMNSRITTIQNQKNEKSPLLSPIRNDRGRNAIGSKSPVKDETPPKSPVKTTPNRTFINESGDKIYYRPPPKPEEKQKQFKNKPFGIEKSRFDSEGEEEEEKEWFGDDFGRLMESIPANKSKRKDSQSQGQRETKTKKSQNFMMIDNDPTPPQPKSNGRRKRDNEFSNIGLDEEEEDNPLLKKLKKTVDQKKGRDKSPEKGNKGGGKNKSYFL